MFIAFCKHIHNLQWNIPGLWNFKASPMTSSKPFKWPSAASTESSMRKCQSYKTNATKCKYTTQCNTHQHSTEIVTSQKYRKHWPNYSSIWWRWLPYSELKPIRKLPHIIRQVSRIFWPHIKHSLRSLVFLPQSMCHSCSLIMIFNIQQYYAHFSCGQFLRCYFSLPSTIAFS